MLGMTQSFAQSQDSVRSDDTNNQEDVAELSTINIRGQQDTGPKISTDKLLKVPGSGGDPLKAIEALPGVVMGGFGPFSIPAIRGSSPEDNIYITDFVPVGYVFHNDGGSTYNSNLVEEFQLKAGAWGPEYNDALGAVINTHLRDPYQEELTTTLDVSLLRAGAMIEGAIDDDSAFYASYRESLLQFYIDNFVDEDEIKFTEVPKNRDYQLKYHWRIDDRSNFRAIATGAHDSVALEFGPESEDLQHEPDLAGGLDADTYYHNQAFLYDTVFDNGTSSIISFSHKEESGDFNAGTLIDITSTNFEYRLKNYYQTPLNNGDTLRYGFDNSSTEIKYEVTGKDTPCNDEFQICAPISTGNDFTTNDSLTINSNYAFTAYDWLATPFLEISFGLGTSYNDFTEENTFQPRLDSRYELNDSWTLTGAIGKHHQFHRNFRFIDKDVGNPDLKMPNSDHYVVGFEYQLDDSISAKLEVYYKDLHDLTISNPEYDESDDIKKDEVKYVNEASGQAYGLELLINKSLTDKWYGWLSVAYSKTKRTNDLTGEDFNYELDRPWIINLVTSYEYSPITTIGWKWRYQSGSLITPVDSSNPSTALYECPGDNGGVIYVETQCDNTKQPYLYAPNYLDKNSERLPASHSLDFRVDFTPEQDTSYYFEMLNVYNQRNVTDYKYNEDYSEREKINDLPTIFNFGVQLIY
jgi:hypothetical protein